MTTSPVPFTPLRSQGCPVCVPAPRYRNHAGLFWDGRAYIDIDYIQGGRHCMHAWYGWDIPGLTSRLGVGRRYPCIFGCFVCSAFLSLSLFLFCCCERSGYVVCPSWICGILTARRFAHAHTAPQPASGRRLTRRGDLPSHPMA